MKDSLVNMPSENQYIESNSRRAIQVEESV